MTKNIGTILVTGATGFLGRHLMPVLKTRYRGKVIGVSSRDYDLTRESQVRRMMKDVRPDVLVHLAALVGGIEANRSRPAEFFYRNVMMNTLTLHYAYKAGVKKAVAPVGACCYPADAPSPIRETSLWRGYPEPTSAPYAWAKSMLLVQAQSYRRQYGFKTSVIIPGNMYGEFDNFDLKNAHVASALVRRFVEAKRGRAPQVVVWGTGKPKRDFVYAADVARAVPFFIENYDSPEPVNVSRGQPVTIERVARIIKEIAGYKGKIVFDISKPDGQRRKGLNVARFRGLGLSCGTPLEAGLRKTVRWFNRQYEMPGAVRLG